MQIVSSPKCFGWSCGNHGRLCYQKLLRLVDNFESEDAKHNPFSQTSADVIMQTYHAQPYANVVDVVNLHNIFEILNVGYMSR